MLNEFRQGFKCFANVSMKRVEIDKTKMPINEHLNIRNSKNDQRMIFQTQDCKCKIYMTYPLFIG